jgi:alkylhydroperoxidase family enzyme
MIKAAMTSRNGLCSSPYGIPGCRIPTDRERAVLAWTEAVTQVADTHVLDDAFENLRQHLNPKDRLPA